MALQDLINQLQQGSQGDWGYDPTLANDVNTLINQAATGENQFDTNRGQINSDYGAFESQNKQNQQTAMQGLKDRFGWTGLINSGVYLRKQGDVGNEFQQMLQAAAQRRTRSLAGVDQQQTMFENQILSALGSSRAGAAERYGQAQQAAAQLAAQQAYQQQMEQLQQQYNAQQEALMRRLDQMGQYQPQAPLQLPPPPPPPAPAAPPPRPGGQPPVPGAEYVPDPTGQGLPGAWHVPGSNQLIQASPEDAAWWNQQNSGGNYAPHGHGFYT